MFKPNCVTGLQTLGRLTIVIYKASFSSGEIAQVIFTNVIFEIDDVDDATEWETNITTETLPSHLQATERLMNRQKVVSIVLDVRLFHLFAKAIWLYPQLQTLKPNQNGIYTIKFKSNV